MTKEQKLAITTGAQYAPYSTNPRCLHCGLCDVAYNPYVFPKLDGPIVLVTSVPTLEEERHGQMGIGREATLIENHLVPPDTTYSVLPTVLCRPVNGKPTVKQVEMCRPFINKLFNRIKGSKKVIAMGVDAAKAVLQRPVTLKEEVGEVLTSLFGPTTVTYSPSMVFSTDIHDGGYKIGTVDVIRTHIARFVNEVPNETFPDMEVL